MYIHFVLNAKNLSAEQHDGAQTRAVAINFR